MIQFKFHLYLQKIVFLVSFIFFGCIGDLYYDSRDGLDDSKVSRSYAVRKFYSALLVKRTLCPVSIDTTLFSAAYYTTSLKSGCNGFSTTKESQRTLRSCGSVYEYVEKKDLTVCLNEVLFFPCESIVKASGNVAPNFPVCRGLFGPADAGSVYL
ncbi:hypothetical protein [Leptospira terpstrae]|uniref:Lipoprotein n=1 Tax=Leptospira terpstrae serovar Hualin str. LT 11-33 = ATCC 700639 TaxID=1257025 RepID=N1VPW1_9LEPT|nr:hypothetical protein [Leptospira terpstrae]EMY60478.1 putative lipoprotein [Leptospira terpstrae serovar Hualin str. LT 11-33 = ATCC 700639]